MPRCAKAKLAVALILSAGALLPTSALADGAPGGGISADPASGAVTLAAPPAAAVHHAVALTGTVAGAPAGRAVVVQRQDPTAGWVTVARSAVDRDGGFAASWRPEQTGLIALRAALDPGAQAGAADAQSGVAQLTVYRAAVATWFGASGDGQLGSHTACGQHLSTTLLGVAHRSLPCGTQVQLFYRGRTITVPVVDRGPYAHGVMWDLTAATAQQLGFDGRHRVGAVVAGSG